MSTQILKEIKSRIEEETRTYPELYTELKFVVGEMMFFRSLNKAQVVACCSNLIKIYELLQPKKTQETDS